MTPQKTHGLVAAPFTPMRADGTINLDLVPQYARTLRDNRVSGAFICGTTGEGMSLTLDERRQMAEAWVNSATERLRVIVHVGHNSLNDCRTLAAHAESIKAGGIACMAPFFFKTNDVEGLVQWCSEVASAAPNVPFYYYHMPSMTGVNVPIHDFLAVAGLRIPSLAGVKYTHEDLEDFARCLKFDNGRYDVMFGRDELLASALSLGAKAAVGSTYNFAAPLYLQLIDAFVNGEDEEVQELQSLAVKMIDVCVTSGAHPIAVFKWLMHRLGLECGPTRLPLKDPTAAQRAQVERQLDTLGVFERFSSNRKSGVQGK